MDTVVFTGGGTGGHVFPGLAVYASLPPSLRERVVWVGSRRGVERGIVSRYPIPYYAVPVGKLRRYFDWENLFDLFRVIAGVVAAWRLLRRVRPRVVFSKGGFVAVPVVVAAYLRRVPIVIHESDADPGLATRLTAPIADRVLVPYHDTARAFSASIRPRVVVTGNPVRAAFREADGSRALDAVGLVDDGSPVVLITGGSLGARQLNELVRDVLPQLSERAVVIHQTGRHGVEMVGPLTAAAVAGRYHGAATFGATFPALLRRADLVVARAGAGTVWEIAVCGRPAVLIPLSTGASRGDQLRNAARYGASGAAVVLDDPHLASAVFYREVCRLLDDSDQRERMARAARGWASGNAAEAIATEITRVMGRRVRRSEGAG